VKQRPFDMLGNTRDPELLSVQEKQLTPPAEAEARDTARD